MACSPARDVAVNLKILRILIFEMEQADVNVKTNIMLQYLGQKTITKDSNDTTNSRPSLKTLQQSTEPHGLTRMFFQKDATSSRPSLKTLQQSTERHGVKRCQSLINVKPKKQKVQDGLSLEGTQMKKISGKKTKMINLKQKEKFPIYEDPVSTLTQPPLPSLTRQTSICTCHVQKEHKEVQADCRETQITAEEEALALLGGEETSEQYWQMMAEQRRLSLEEVVKENELVWSENKALREENEKLYHYADDAEYFAFMLKMYINQQEVEAQEKVNKEK